MSADAQAAEPEPFHVACAARSLGDGTFTTDLRPEWSIGSHPHGGFLVALLSRVATDAVAEGGGPEVSPLAISAEFLRPPECGPVLLRTEVRKAGRRTTVMAVALEQRGRSCVEARVTAGRLPEKPPVWSDIPAMSPEPPGNALTHSPETLSWYGLGKGCDVRLDPETAGFVSGRTGDPPRIRMWIRPRTGEVDPFFALLAADANPPVILHLGRPGWAPTAQLTGFVRTQPAPGWLRVQVDCRSVNEGWFDSDAVVVDERGHVVCQARQLALSPAPKS